VSKTSIVSFVSQREKESSKRVQRFQDPADMIQNIKKLIR